MIGLSLSLPTAALRIPNALEAPVGYIFITDADGAILIDGDGTYLVEAL
ncbi:hypothetical protein SAMN06297144_1860 [Sphingomonas guangdongensis]|uniref:Uncharacterized protein n=1 Tax=Sphingomonas guangdongensis TaxID=1141890 RepID=A0A285QY48_9SPHN|nr:hypothetical protein [Sphingomonas guangdongensis]SOB86751.1 hypothetical protein SAMN06297144_1860 [Sphingomonas guangdongensis]